jgi:hypothetical protein
VFAVRALEFLLDEFFFSTRHAAFLILKLQTTVVLLLDELHVGMGTVPTGSHDLWLYKAATIPVRVQVGIAPDVLDPGKRDDLPNRFFYPQLDSHLQTTRRCVLQRGASSDDYRC